MLPIGTESGSVKVGHVMNRDNLYFVFSSYTDVFVPDPNVILKMGINYIKECIAVVEVVSHRLCHVERMKCSLGCQPNSLRTTVVEY